MNIHFPTLIVDKDKCIANIRMMHEKAKKGNIIFRPHFKTHQSAEIGEWFRDEGVKAITVSSVRMAEYFADHGWNDITIAFAVNLLEIENINKLAQKIKLNLLVENPETLKFIAGKLQHPAGIFIKIDTGYHRTGIAYNDFSIIDHLLQIIRTSHNIKFSGFLTHNGNTYSASSKADVETIFRNSNINMVLLKQKYIEQFREIIISVGDTPSCSIENDFTNVDEIRPGNFIFYDAMQLHLGSCHPDQIAAVLACPVISKNEERCELVIYGGAVHFSKDAIADKSGNRIFGLVSTRDKKGLRVFVPETSIFSLTQEHGIIKTNKTFFNTISIGDIVHAIPVHSCLCASNFSEYALSDGEMVSNIRS
jgi:D-serine deaminase-like pyridoxal phosphate-dependent protein